MISVIMIAESNEGVIMKFIFGMILGWILWIIIEPSIHSIINIIQSEFPGHVDINNELTIFKFKKRLNAKDFKRNNWAIIIYFFGINWQWQWGKYNSECSCKIWKLGLIDIIKYIKE